MCALLFWCHYLRLEDFDTDNILIDEKSHENIYDIKLWYKNLIGPKPLPIIFNKINGFIGIYGRTRYLTLLRPENYDAIYNRIRYLISLKSNTTYILFHCLVKIKVDSYDFLLMEKRLTLYDVIMLIKWVLNKHKNHYHFFKVFFRKMFVSIS